ncbi:indolepyruvate oxidoreductase subunit beta family protein [Ramlibacter sp. AW1]|uniref:Indolepyruvate oxidoreductase subunit beta family protein n=1 Tax=Ramlibacter aurantiacus TaxID=2801330 RepID=A0A937D505_9BURK|nr:indolepyruvate oxidoreductase subunit beta family protein [Ramlibacter aurantiacus]MBL0420847.1 indolepyruvate oxidoreductase subunit beta family protein [Ramlibacter aurantiacus]
MNNDKAITLLVCALGGEGGGVLTEWLVETARHAGYPAQATSIPGVAQRTGATTYYVEVFPQPIASLGGRRPVFSLNPVPGALDALVSSELLETARQIGNGMSTPDRTRVITSTSRSLTTIERMQMGDGRVESPDLLAVVKAFSREHHVFDMSAVAKECGTVVSAVMLGAIAASGLFPFKREDYEAAVKAGGAATAAASLRGFAKAFEIVGRAQEQAAYLQAVIAPPPAEQTTPSVPPQVLQRFPQPVHEMLSLGYARLVDYQDAAYAERYLQRLAQVLQAEQAADPNGAHGFATTTEMARWLALWMAFDDIVRVADLKSRASRWQRVRGEVKAGDDDLLQLWDHFKPGVPEFAALLPPALAQRLVAWDRRRAAAGRAPWALPLKVGTHSVFGMLSLRVLASCKALRVRGSRFAVEQAMIDRWLQGVVDGSRRDWALGHEIALCGRLIKGYGATNERGKENLLHVLDHLAHGESPEASARAIAEARQAALADEAGTALDATLARHGAPPRPVKEQPIRFVRKPRPAAPHTF